VLFRISPFLSLLFFLLWCATTWGRTGCSSPSTRRPPSRSVKQQTAEKDQEPRATHTQPRLGENETQSAAAARGQPIPTAFGGDGAQRAAPASDTPVPIVLRGTAPRGEQQQGPRRFQSRSTASEHRAERQAGAQQTVSFNSSGVHAGAAAGSATIPRLVQREKRQGHHR